MLRQRRKPSQCAAAMKESLAEAAASKSPGPSQGRKCKLSSPQLLRGSKRNRGSQLQRQAARGVSESEPIPGLAEGLVALGYEPDFEIMVRIHFFIYFKTHEKIIVFGVPSKARKG